MKKWIAVFMAACLLLGTACADGIIGSADGPAVALLASGSGVRISGVNAAAAALVLRWRVGELVRVSGSSMADTLKPGETVYVSKTAYGKNGEGIARNDVVLCHYPDRVAWSIPISKTFSLTRYALFIQRVVALPGDTVEIRDGVLYVNGEATSDPEKLGSRPTNYAVRTLGEDEYFVMGDNRRYSHDSRYADVGPLSAEMIVGKVLCVVLPLSSIRKVE